MDVETFFKCDEFPTVEIGWVGGATFRIIIDGLEVDCFTRYGTALGIDAGPCTPSEAYWAARDYFKSIIEDTKAEFE